MSGPVTQESKQQEQSSWFTPKNIAAAATGIAAAAGGIYYYGSEVAGYAQKACDVAASYMPTMPWSASEEKAVPLSRRQRRKMRTQIRDSIKQAKNQALNAEKAEKRLQNKALLHSAIGTIRERSLEKNSSSHTVKKGTTAQKTRQRDLRKMSHRKSSRRQNPNRSNFGSSRQFYGMSHKV
jgi:hypothetical protein